MKKKKRERERERERERREKEKERERRVNRKRTREYKTIIITYRKCLYHRYLLQDVQYQSQFWTKSKSNDVFDWIPRSEILTFESH